MHLDLGPVGLLACYGVLRAGFALQSCDRITLEADCLGCANGNI